MKKKLLLTSVLSIILCFSLICGATFALFTSESKVNIAVSSGKVSVIANIDENSVETKQLNTEYAQGKDNMFVGADAATFGAEGLTLEKFVPGDGIKFNIVVKNESTVTVKYRTIISCVNDNGLFAGLNVNVGNKQGYNGITFVSDWTEVAAGSADAIVPVSIELPDGAGNEYQDKTCTISYKVEAVQGNAQVENPEDGVLYIWNVYDLKNFRNAVNSGTTFSGETVKLAADIDLNNEEWTPIGSFDYDRDSGGSGYANVVMFQGTFDGQGHVISNLYVNTPEKEYAGLFGCVQGATIENLTVKNVDITAGSHAAAILARASSLTTVTNCHVKGNISIVVDWAYAGAIVAKATDFQISDCSVTPNGTGSITAENRNAVGGIVGWTESRTTVTNCSVKDMNLTGWANIGGVLGFISGNASSVTGCEVENVIINKTRDGANASLGYVAGGWGYTSGKMITISNNTIKNVELNGNYVANTDYLKGINVLIGSGYYGTEDVSKALVESNNVLENVTDNRYCKISTVAELETVLTAGVKGVLVADIDLDSVALAVTSNATLDLNGKTISDTAESNGYHAMLQVKKPATLTITDSVGTGKITYHSDNNTYTGATVWVDGGNLVLESGTLELTGTWSIGFALDVRALNYKNVAPTVTMNGGKIISADAAVRVTDGIGSNSTSFTMNDGTIEAVYDGIFVQQMETATNKVWDILNVTVNGGTIKSAWAPIRVYASDTPDSCLGTNGKCITIALDNDATLTYTGTATYTWVVENKVRYSDNVNIPDHTTIGIIVNSGEEI